MVEGRFDIDEDRKSEIVVRGGLLASIVIVVVSDLMITGGEFTLEVVNGIFRMVSG